MATISDYTKHITSEHDDKPRFLATLGALLQGVIDCNNSFMQFPAKFDLDTAIGQQLDYIGQWVGFSRTLVTPIPDVLFSFDTPGVGFDEGSIDGPGNPATGIILLDDETYRLMLYLQIQSNSWDGSMQQAESILAAALVNFPDTHIFIQDNMDMSMFVGVVGTLPSRLFQALLAGGYFNLRPAAVQLAGVLVAPGPIFGFDVENYNISGFDVGTIT